MRGRLAAFVAVAGTALLPAAARASGNGRAAGAAPDSRPRLDVVAYDFQVSLPDSGGVVAIGATVRFRRPRGAPDTLRLDLIGLTVDSVLARAGGAQGAGVGAGAGFTRSAFAYDGRRIAIPLAPARADGRAGAMDSVAVFYHGAPTDGLLIGPDAHGRRAAFADDWPERARYWLATVDEPSDKATVKWLVRAPGDWVVVANGILTGHGTSPDGRSWWAYTEHHPIPTYTMVIGAGVMTVSRHPPAVWDGDTVPISVWAEPQDSAFADSVPFREDTRIVETLMRLVGPFPYEKLANVESSTRYGGMENSTAIFYAQRPYATGRMRESVVRHETSHQWFGDAVTEADFHHLWLSEGFATYFDLVVGAALHGDSVLTYGMRRNARSYFASRVVDRPVLDTTVTRPVELLDANSYQKGAWVLHMLREMIGDTAFFRGIRAYYRTYRDSSVLTVDFRKIMERAAHRPLAWFFNQWLRQPGYPRLDVAWSAAGGGGRRVTLEVRQTQPAAWGRYRVPAVPVEFLRAGQVVARRSFELKPEASQRTSFALGAAPDSVAVDPAGTLLLTAAVQRR